MTRNQVAMPDDEDPIVVNVLPVGGGVRVDIVIGWARRTVAHVGGPSLFERLRGVTLQEKVAKAIERAEREAERMQRAQWVAEQAVRTAHGDHPDGPPAPPSKPPMAGPRSWVLPAPTSARPAAPPVPPRPIR